MGKVGNIERVKIASERDSFRDGESKRGRGRKGKEREREKC